MHGFDFDPTPLTLARFVVYMSHHIQPRSVSTYLSGICNQLEVTFPHVRLSRRYPLVGCLALPPNANSHFPLTISLRFAMPTLLYLMTISSFLRSLFAILLVFTALGNWLILTPFLPVPGVP
jgi:hypothetical protein